MKHYYEVLDVPHTASAEEIKSQYRRLVRIYHPDLFINPIEKHRAEEKLKQINEAYTALSKHDGSEAATGNEYLPRPVVTPDKLDFGVMMAGSQSRRKFQVGTVGRLPKDFSIAASQQKGWFSVGAGRRIFPERPLPMEFEVTIDTAALDSGKAYDGWIDVRMDNVIARVSLSLRVEQPRVRPVFSVARLSLALAVLALILIGITSFSNPELRSWFTAAPPPASDVAPNRLVPPHQLLFVVHEGDQSVIFTATDKGGSQRSLQLHGELPAPSPDGQHLAYVMQATDGTHLFVKNFGASEPLRLTTTSASKQSLAWAPNSNALAFIEGQADAGLLEIVEFPAGRVVPLTKRDLGSVKNFSWSPDGTRLIFNVLQGDTYRIYTIKADGSGLRSYAEMKSQAVAFSPDGELVAIAAEDGLYVLDAQGDNLRKLGEMSASEVQWSPDGLQIAFLSTLNGQANSTDLWTINRDGKELTRVTESGAITFAWSPDGGEFAYITGSMQENPPILYLWLITRASLKSQLVAEVNEPFVAWTE